jgi:hypothetical protein
MYRAGLFLVIASPIPPIYQINDGGEPKRLDTVEFFKRFSIK